MATATGLLRIETLNPHVVEVLRRKTSRERLQMAFEANRLVRERLTSHLRHEYPQWDEDAVVREVARRILWNSPTS